MVASILFSSAAAQAGGARKIALPNPGKVVTVMGNLQGTKHRKEFFFDVVKDTNVTIKLSADGPIRGDVIFPSGHHEGGPDGEILNQHLTETGNYRLQVSESNMGEKWKGKFEIQITVNQ